MAIVWDDYLTAAKNASAADKQKALNDSQALYDKQRDSLNEEYNYGIEQASKAYEDQYRTNAVQKLINERQVAENMANLGLTDSGLNRTQQTAVQLSYANNKANLDRSKQSQIDALERERASGLSTIEQNRLTAAASIEDKYNQLASENATALYNADKEAATAAASASGSAGDGLYYFRRNETDKYGKTVKIFEINGKEIKVKEGINPYTNNNNKLNKNASKYGFYDNGYQPKGIVAVDGTDYGPLTSTGVETYITGKRQMIRRTHSGSGNYKYGGTKYWVWLGDENAYQELELKEDGQFYPTNNIVYF